MFISCDFGGIEPVLGQVIARSWSWALLDDVFGSDAEPVIVPDYMMDLSRSIVS